MNVSICELKKTDIPKVLEVLKDESKEEISYEDASIVQSYWTLGFLGYGAFNNGKLLGYCFIKTPTRHPETLTVILSKYRNKGLATKLRDVAIADRQFSGKTIYSICHYQNIASFKSLLKSGFMVRDITIDGNIHFIKWLMHKPYATAILPYNVII